MSERESSDTGAGVIEDPEMTKLFSLDKNKDFEVFGAVEASDLDELEEDINDVEKMIKASKDPVGKGFWKVVPAIYREYYIKIFRRKEK